ncbi:hypothetical protein [Alteromonas sp. AMM-1]|uniref:phage tail terminator protein n=1 Tax=Alteromonas sp. AMM-1 TaxID=3394233 RepID=UPI0039A55845
MLTLVQTRIKPIFDHVGGAANVREAMGQPIHRSSVAYVVPVSESPVGNSRDVDIGQPLQESVITFGVVIGIKSINDSTGEKALIQLEQLRTALRNSLYGWKPSSDFEPVLLSKSDLVGFATQGLWWIDRFITNTWYQGVNG